MLDRALSASCHAVHVARPARCIPAGAARASRVLQPVAPSRPSPSWSRQARRGKAVQVQSLFGWGQSSSTVADDETYYDGRVTVAKVQVGLLGSARQLQKDLEAMADHADTESPEGLKEILQETVLALMRNPDYCIYGHSTGAACADGDRAESRFNEYSMEERGKFQAETRVNVEGRERRSSLAATPKGAPAEAGPQELIVVTILVAAEGAFKLPKITSRADLKKALARLGSVPVDDILAVEVLWTPEEEGDFFTLQDLAIDYPLLNTL